MYYKKCANSRYEKYCGEDIVLQDIPLQVFNDIIQFTYEIELKRQESIITQSNSMLVFVSLLSAGFCTVLPSIFTLFKEQETKLFIICCCAVFIGILLLSSLILILFSQWRLLYKTTPNIVDVKRHLSKVQDDVSKESLFSEYAEIFLPKMLMSLREMNNLRCYFVIASMVLMLITLIAFIISFFIVMFLYWGVKNEREM